MTMQQNNIIQTTIKVRYSALTLALASIGFNPLVMATEKEDLLALKNTTVNLIEMLVDQGVLDKQKAQAMIQKAEQKAKLEASQQLEEANAKAANFDNAGGNKNPKSVRVSYVPEFVKEEIRDQVRAELKADVVKEVKADAQKESWGVPAALPEWVRNTKISGDARLRAQNDNFDSNNDGRILDYAAINREGGLNRAGKLGLGYLNSTEDRFRFRERFRLALDSKITDHMRAGVRLSTTNDYSPVSSNQTLGNTGQSYQVALDRGFLEYDYVDSQGNDLLTLTGGRFANPWLSTDMMFSPELSFEGFAGTLRLPFGSSSSTAKSTDFLIEPSSRFGLQSGRQHPQSMFVTLGAFPLQEVDMSTTDKWLFAGQVGGDWLLSNRSRLMLAAAYYDYRNVRARPNGFNSYQYDWTAPQFMQKGNTLVPIVSAQNINADARCYGESTGCLWGLASDYRIASITAMYDMAVLGDKHLLLTADVAKNFGYDSNRIANLFPGYWNALGANGRHSLSQDRTNAFQVRADFGKSEIRGFNDWSALVAYRYIERDAILDAFTDSVFHQGGTDAQGWMLGMTYGLMRNTWLNLRWFSTDNIDGPRYSIDTATLDLNVRL